MNRSAQPGKVGLACPHAIVACSQLAVTPFISLALLAAWLLYFDQDVVRRIGFVYAERLFEYLPSSVPRKRAAKQTHRHSSS